MFPLGCGLGQPWKQERIASGKRVLGLRLGHSPSISLALLARLDDPSRSPGRFASELKMVVENWTSGKQEFILQNYEIMEASGYQTWRDYVLVPEATWKQRHGVNASEIGCLVPEA